MNDLRQKRKELGITQIQAANACGVSRRTYQTYEETDSDHIKQKELMEKLSKINVVSVKAIQNACKELFKKNYSEVRCAYLYGSYARGEATDKSDIDIVVVCSKGMGMKLFGISVELEEMLHKKIDLHTHRQIINNVEMIKDILVEGIKIYG